MLQADDDVVRAAFRRLTQPAKGATYTPAELVVLLNQSDARVPIKSMTRALSLCLENKVRQTAAVRERLLLELRGTVCYRGLRFAFAARVCEDGPFWLAPYSPPPCS